MKKLDYDFNNIEFTKEELENARKDLMTEDGFLEDPRFKQCQKEGRYGIIIALISLVLWFVFGYGLGSKNVEEYSYIFGFPMWFFLSCIVTPVITIGLALFATTKIKDTPLDKFTEEDAIKYHALQRRKNNV